MEKALCKGILYIKGLLQRGFFMEKAFSTGISF